jgi:hypothetical protein
MLRLHTPPPIDLLQRDFVKTGSASVSRACSVLTWSAGTDSSAFFSLCTSSCASLRALTAVDWHGLSIKTLDEISWPMYLPSSFSHDASWTFSGHASAPQSHSEPPPVVAITRTHNLYLGERGECLYRARAHPPGPWPSQTVTNAATYPARTRPSLMLRTKGSATCRGLPCSSSGHPPAAGPSRSASIEIGTGLRPCARTPSPQPPYLLLRFGIPRFLQGLGGHHGDRLDVPQHALVKSASMSPPSPPRANLTCLI